MTLLIIQQDDDFDKSLTVALDDKAGKILFDSLRPLFEKTMADEEFWLEDYDTSYNEHNFIDFDDLPADVLSQAYNIIKSIQDYNELKPYVKELKQKIEADPRFV